MARQFSCSSCGRVIESDVVPGQPVRCPFCEAVVTVPGPAAPPIMPGPVPQAAVSGMPLRTGLATGSLICGVIGTIGCFPLAIAGLVLGVLALTRANGQPTMYGGRGRAIGGITTGGIGTVVTPILLVLLVLLPSLSRAREQAKRVRCAANLHWIARGFLDHAMNNSDPLPADPFPQLLQSGAIAPTVLVCPGSAATEADVVNDSHACYVFVSGAAGLPLVGLPAPARTVIVYEKKGHHPDGGNVLFADGHVEFITPYDRVLEMVQESEARLEEVRAGRSRR